jgi:hypothetical protein
MRVSERSTADETNPENARFGRQNAAPAAQLFWISTVAGYRLYGLDGVDKVASGEWIEAEDDETAIEVAKTMMDGHDCELWQGRRLVARIPHERKN